MTPITPLERWISEKTGSGGPPEPARLLPYQLAQLRAALRLVRSKSRFYGKLLADIEPDSIKGLEDVRKLPFTTAADIAARPEDFLCVSPRDIDRIVTLSTSGTTGAPKRLFFTEEDQELTVDFFHRGMMTMAEVGDRVMIFMPGQTPGSVGDLLKMGLARFDCSAVVYGPIRDYEDALAALISEKAAVLVGIPSQILRLSRTKISGALQKPALKSVLLSADYVPVSVTRAIEEAWDVPVYGHYGLTESGLGGGVECAARCGYHLREADLLFEIIDPVSGLPVQDGITGEVVFTTLTRAGMPLIRYRTGDIARFMTEPCPCGSVLRRLDRVKGRLSDFVILSGGRALSIAQLDELVYADPTVLAFAAALDQTDGSDRLILTVEGGDGFDAGRLARELDALLGGGVTLELRRGAVNFHTTGTLKRRIVLPGAGQRN